MEKQKALYEKEKGNTAYKNGKYQEAVEFYSKGIEADTGQPVLYCNRAMALLKLNKNYEAKLDCDAALILDRTYVKAYYRRGLAYSSFNDVDKALDDFKKVLELEPQNKEAQKELEKLNRLIDQNSESLLRVTPIEKPKHLISSRLSRVKITEVRKMSVQSQQEKISSRTKAVPRKELERLAKATDPASISTDISNIAQSVPKSAFQFLSGWRSLKQDSKKFYSYLIQIPTCSYVTVMDSCLEPVLISDVLNAFAEHGRDRHEDASTICQCLKRISEMKNFKTCKLFFDDKDALKLNAILNFLKSELSDVNEEDIADLRNRFSV